MVELEVAFKLNGGTVDVALTADFVTATASGTPSVVIQDLVNTDQGAQRN